MEKIIFDYNAFIAANFNGLYNHLDELTGTLEFKDGVFRIITMEEEGKVLDALWAWHGQHDVDVLGYTMQMTMKQNEDQDFVTTLIIIITDAHN